MPNGWTRGRWWIWRNVFPTPAGHDYLGPCRCGFGPNAFYRTPEGRIVHASQLFFPMAGPATSYPPTTVPPTLKPEEEAKLLEEEAKAIQEELKRVEERLKELKK